MSPYFETRKEATGISVEPCGSGAAGVPGTVRQRGRSCWRWAGAGGDLRAPGRRRQLSASQYLADGVAGPSQQRAAVAPSAPREPLGRCGRRGLLSAAGPSIGSVAEGTRVTGCLLFVTNAPAVEVKLS